LKRKTFVAAFNSIIIIFALFVIAFIVFGFKFEKTNNEKLKYEIENIKTNEKMISVMPLSQYPDLPTGCESTAAAMILNFYKYDTSPKAFAQNILIKEDFYYENGYLCGPHPNEAFIGNPFSSEGYGCYAGAIVSSINKNLNEITAVNISGKSLDDIINDYINCGIPVMLWATMGMKNAKEGTSWYLENGELFTWISGEHCYVLVGYNENFYFLNDPQLGTTVAHEKSLVEKRYKELNSQAVYIYKSK